MFFLLFFLVTCESEWEKISDTKQNAKEKEEGMITKIPNQIMEIFLIVEKAAKEEKNYDLNFFKVEKLYAVDVEPTKSRIVRGWKREKIRIRRD